MAAKQEALQVSATAAVSPSDLDLLELQGGRLQLLPTSGKKIKQAHSRPQRHKQVEDATPELRDHTKLQRAASTSTHRPQASAPTRQHTQTESSGARLQIKSNLDRIRINRLLQTRSGFLPLPALQKNQIFLS